jgi:hypothetical protein
LRTRNFLAGVSFRHPRLASLRMTLCQVCVVIQDCRRLLLLQSAFRSLPADCCASGSCDSVWISARACSSCSLR